MREYPFDIDDKVRIKRLIYDMIGEVQSYHADMVMVKWTHPDGKVHQDYVLNSNLEKVDD